MLKTKNAGHKYIFGNVLCVWWWSCQFCPAQNEHMNWSGIAKNIDIHTDYDSKLNRDRHERMFVSWAVIGQW